MHWGPWGSLVILVGSGPIDSGSNPDGPIPFYGSNLCLRLKTPREGSHLSRVCINGLLSINFSIHCIDIKGASESNSVPGFKSIKRRRTNPSRSPTLSADSIMSLGTIFCISVTVAHPLQSGRTNWFHTAFPSSVVSNGFLLLPPCGSSTFFIMPAASKAPMTRLILPGVDESVMDRGTSPFTTFPKRFLPMLSSL